MECFVLFLVLFETAVNLHLLKGARVMFESVMSNLVEIVVIHSIEYDEGKMKRKTHWRCNVK